MCRLGNTQQSIHVCGFALLKSWYFSSFRLFPICFQWNKSVLARRLQPADSSNMVFDSSTVRVLLPLILQYLRGSPAVNGICFAGRNFENKSVGTKNALFFIWRHHLHIINPSTRFRSTSSTMELVFENNVIAFSLFVTRMTQTWETQIHV